MLPKKSSSRLSFTGSSTSTTLRMPKPYMGQTGPLRKPRFTNLPVFRAAKATSAHQPRQE